MRIAISGVQCTGKTTLLNALKKVNALKDYTFIPEVIRGIVKSKGISINENSTDSGQIAILNAHLDNLKNENFIADRSLIDCMAYTVYAFNHHQITPRTFWKVVSEFRDNVKNYDLVFYIKPEFEMQEDGVRSTDKAFRDEVKGYMEKALKGLRVVYLTGPVEDRVKQFMDAFYDKESE